MAKKLYEFNIPYDRLADESKDLIVSLSNIRSSTATTEPVSVFIKYPLTQETFELTVYLAVSDGENIRGYITHDQFNSLKLTYYMRQSALANLMGGTTDEI